MSDLRSGLNGAYIEYMENTLRTSPVPLSTRDMAIRLRFHHLPAADYQVSGLLRSMLRDGLVEHRNGRWFAPFSSKKSPFQPVVCPPPLSAETLSVCSIADASSTVQRTEPDPASTESDTARGRWEVFRKLLGYYRQCMRNEEGADASAFQNELGRRFIYLRKAGPWYPIPGRPWQTSISLGPHLSGFVNALPSATEEDALVIGYPIQAFYKKKEDEPDVAIIRPIFFFPVEHTISRDGLIVRCENSCPEVNLGWLEYAFSRKPERQRSFLSACGFINCPRPEDEAPGLERGELAPNLENLVTALAAFMPEKVRHPLKMDYVSDHSLSEPFETGIYNRAVLMLAKRTKYSATLLKELSVIEKAPDEVLDETALRFIFNPKGDFGNGETEALLHEALVADTDELNAEQRKATAFLLTRSATVVTGPPGTGKSQVVSAAAANARLFGQSVLFSSRNHKAIDAVLGRLTDVDGRPLMIRTNAKEDPNLKFTFVDAIRNMLTEPRDPVMVQHLDRAKEEIGVLLAERGRNADYARQAAEAGTTLGELEERMSFLARDLPGEMVTFLDDQPERFPANAVSKMIQAVRALFGPSSPPFSFERFLDLIRTVKVFPSHLAARRRLNYIPGAPKLTLFLATKALKALAPILPILEKATAYARLRIQCHPIESKLAELPLLEDTTQAVADLSRRIREVTCRATALDLDSRRGLPSGADREQLEGLRASLNAMRTGLQERVIHAETVRILEQRSSHILQAFPCWAVTSLSVGSRIPLVPAMFDLAIVDEASQSDIPSAIPILYRARRAGVVGDPFQLTHTSKLTTSRDTILRRQVGLNRVEDVRFAYTESSLYDLFAGTPGVEPVFLGETYRSDVQIAGYSNLAFYGGRLRVATDQNRLTVPQGMTTGIHWSDVAGQVQSGGGSGCYCQQEIDKVIQIVRTMLLDNHFKGTLGVVAPFRQQANRLRDILFESETIFHQALIRAQTHVDTAHGFQGDERDVIIFSLCAGPDMPAGAISFLRETGYLFNVAVSRARAVLHVVGNREWARRCGIRHVEQLAGTIERTATTSHHGPWHPHESPWEEKLFQALVEKGLEPRPQFPVSSRRLDMALVRQDDSPLKIDIEVDGDCHRNSDGTRKMDDLWRDIQLQGLGWKVMRFWTYQLREDMPGCVEKIQNVWSEHD